MGGVEVSVNMHPRVLIVGGGTGGITVAARLARSGRALDITVLEPSDRHYYQPLWTLVGGGAARKEDTVRAEADYIPAGVRWVRDRAREFRPEQKLVITAGGEALAYDALVVAPGIQIDWGKIDGLEGALGRDGVCSNYSYETVDSTWRFIRGLRGGRAIFTMPGTPVKCGGAPQKIMWLAEHHFRRAGVRDQVEVVYASAGAKIFAVAKYAQTLARLVVDGDIYVTGRVIQGAETMVLARKDFDNLDNNAPNNDVSLGGVSFVLAQASTVNSRPSMNSSISARP